MAHYKYEIYKQYLKSREVSKVPKSKESFNSRKPFFQYLIKSHFPQNKESNILDLGCGAGGFLYFMNVNGYKNVQGVDLSDDSVRAAQELGIENVVKADILQFLKSSPEHNYDVITAIDVIEHMQKSEVFDLANLMFEKLKPGGILILHQPNGAGIFVGSVLYGDFTHETAFTNKSMNQIFKSAGFDSINCYEDKPLCFSFKSFIRRMLWSALVRPIYSFLLAVETGRLDKNTLFTQNFTAVIKK